MRKSLFEVEKNRARIFGKLMSEDPRSQWQPFISQLKDAISYFRSLIIDFRIEGMLSSNTMYIMSVLRYLDELPKEYDITVNWHYLEMDEDMQFYGEEFREELKRVKVNIISVAGEVLNPGYK
jgi:hypothetical protein